MGSCSTGNCGNTSQMFEAPPQQVRAGPGGQVEPSTEPQVAQSKSGGCANGSCGGGASGGNKMAHSRAGGCSDGSCGGSSKKSSAKAAKSAGGCSDGSCGGGDKAESGKKAAKAGGGGGLKSTVMTVAGMELAQLTLDYSQYIS